MNFFIDLIDTGKIRTKEELRSVYRQFVKTYHPDSALAHPAVAGRGKDVDFDDLKRDYLAAAERLVELADVLPDRSTAPFRYEAEAFIGELRDLVARGLPVSEKALRKNKAYAASRDYVAKCLDQLYGGAYGFAQLDGQLKFLKRRLPWIYYYTLQVFWSAYDCASGYINAKAIAKRHLDFIAGMLNETGFASLVAFLDGVIETAVKVSAKAR